MKRSIAITALLCLLVVSSSVARQNAGATVNDIEALLEQKAFSRADIEIKKRIPLFIQQKNVDTLAAYVLYIGKVNTALYGKDKGRAAVLQFVNDIKKQFPYHGDLLTIYFRAADHLANQGNASQAYDLMVELKKYFAPRPDSIRPSAHRVESNLGSYSMDMGNYALASDHYRESLRLVEKIEKPDLVELFIANNSMGIAMWYASKLDSCLYYFQKAVDILNKGEESPLNQYYRVAMLQNNMGNVYNEQGRAAEAIQSFNHSIDNYQRFINTPEPHMRKEYAGRARLQSIDNLAKTYTSLGDYTKGMNLLQYACEQKKVNFGPKSPEVAKSYVYLGSNFFSMREYEKAQQHLQKALELIKETGEADGIWQADAYTFLALISKEKGELVAAEEYFRQAAAVYQTIIKEGYSAEYLQYLDEASIFYAENKQQSHSQQLADQALRYAITNQGNQSIVSFTQVINMAKVQHLLGNYQQSSRYSRQALDILEHLVANSKTLLDSLMIEKEKPLAIMLKVKAAYYLDTSRSEQVLTGYLEEMNEALRILEKRKSVFAEPKDINTLNANNKDLLDFIKSLQLALYNKTAKSSYLDQLISLQETGIYSRIRSRLDKRRGAYYLHVPENILKQEDELKEQVTRTLQVSRSGQNSVQHYLDAINKLNAFKNMLKEKYPQYYQMRYASTPVPDLATLAGRLPQDQTVVRFLFADDALFALVMDRTQQQWIRLSQDSLSQRISSLLSPGRQANAAGRISYDLYRQLWQPLEKHIRQQRIVIVPDGILYNLSFEMLSTAPANTFAALTAHALLNKYAISYHYSLLALQPAIKQQRKNGNFVAFAPGFSDEEKLRYRRDMKGDSLRIDQSYLSLVPLPFTIGLAKKIKNQLGGNLFVSSSSTPAVFKTRAANHTIIHIGTHAEASNVSPEYSRLIFAKNPEDGTEENSLYLFDIYGCDLSADLAVLTACETGKPGYQDGEGMISMAHAFNYAGSESIMTGLWKIDEQASTIISEYFYQNLQQGMTKDEALRQAKLKYLASADERMQAPEYWAGLVIMGDTSPVMLQKNKVPRWYWIAAIGLAALATAFILRKRRGQRMAAA